MLRAGVVAAGLAAAGLLYGADPPPVPPDGDGFGGTTCESTPSPACNLYAGTPDRAPAPRAPQARGDPRGTAPESGTDAVRSGVTCSYARSDFQPPPGGVATVAFHRPSGPPLAVPAVRRVPAADPPPGTPGSGPGAWYVWRCSGSGDRDALYRPPVWIPDGPGAAAAAGPSLAELAQLARRQLRPAAPVIAANPAGEQLVNLPTWLWLEGGWAPAAATAAVPGVSVTARATPTSVVWLLGDGTRLVCPGPGTPYPVGVDPASASPDCGHTYRRSSAGEAGQAFAVTATVVWTVTWAGAGQAGTFPDLETTGTAALRVAESQAVNGPN